MQHVDFYIMSSTNFDECIPFCSKLVQKAYKAKNSCIIYTENEQMVTQLDDRLWQDNAEHFIPHHKHNEQNNVIEVIQTQTKNKHPIWINYRCADLTIADNLWQRCLQVVPNQPALVAAARQQYRAYKQQGIQVKSHKIG
jgi:DNA polymerase III subunit chi